MKNSLVVSCSTHKPVVVARGHIWPGGKHIVCWNFEAQRRVQEAADEAKRKSSFK